MTTFIGCSRSPDGVTPASLAERLRAISGSHAAGPVKTFKSADLLAAGQGFAGDSIDIADIERRLVLVAGNHSWSNAEYAAIAEQQGNAIAVGCAFERHGIGFLEYLHGIFAASLYDWNKRLLHLATDRFGVMPLYFAPLPGGGTAWGSSTRALRLIPSVQVAVSPQAIFHYLYFHMVPSPDSIYEGIYKLRPGEVVTIGDQEIARRRYWSPQFAESAVNERDLAGDIRRSLSESVAHYAGDRPGTFLSGGLDSSTVTGLLAKVREGDVDAYSIGFSADGYDEMEYARIAARHFGVRHHEYYVTPEDVLAAVPKIAAAYDEPFGNSSAVPTYVCSKVARENGTAVLLAGDGGDELFGGNARYLKQRVFEYYFRLPAAMRKIFEARQERESLANWIPYLGKFYRYVAQAKVPLPDRLQSYNFMERQPLSALLSERMLALIDPEKSRRLQREEYALDSDASSLNRMLRLDWRFTLADNDLRKVGAMTRLAGVEVRYPMLDDSVVSVANKIPSRLKIAHHTLRAFYKEAFKDFLPAAILSKSKHGFGLPFGVWVLDHPGLHEMAFDAIISLKNRDILAAECLDKLLDQHRQEHAAYYGEMIWVLMMLELWFQSQDDVYSA